MRLGKLGWVIRLIKSSIGLIVVHACWSFSTLTSSALFSRRRASITSRLRNICIIASCVRQGFSLICGTTGRPLFINLKGSGESFVWDIGASESSRDGKVGPDEIPSLSQFGDSASIMVDGRCWESISDSGRLSEEGEVNTVCRQQSKSSSLKPRRFLRLRELISRGTLSIMNAFGLAFGVQKLVAVISMF